jgi:hypothetical protein
MSKNSARRATLLGLAFVAGGLLAAAPASAQVVSAEYRYPASVNGYIGNFTSEVWAKVWRPTFTGTQKYPLVVMLHGQHGTCGNASYVPRHDDNDQYITSGTCPSGYSVVKSHEGYAYLASDLASRGYIVVSINSNRGFMDDGFPGDYGGLKARGRLALWHLYKLNQWTTGAEATPASLGVSLQNRIDLNQVGLMGHSRGGTGMRSALAAYRESATSYDINWQALIPGLRIRALLELAPQEQAGGEVPITDAYDIPFLHIVGMCDGELSTIPAVVSQHFDRLLRNAGSEQTTSFKATYGIYGANHRYFNSEWQQNDTPLGCVNQTALFTGAANETGSQSQRDAGLTAVRAFFLATVGENRDPTQMRIFDPAYAAPAGPPIARAFSPSPSYANSSHLEAFDNPKGINSNWVPNDYGGLLTYEHQTNAPEHDPSYPYAFIQWTSSSANNYLQTNWISAGSGQDLSTNRFLEFRVERVGDQPVDFNIQLVHADNTRSSSVALSSYLTVPAQPGTKAVGGSSNTPSVFYHPPFRTVRIPLTAFAGANLKSLRGLRFTFNKVSTCSAASPCGVDLASIVATVDGNLARARTVTVSSSENATLDGTKATDGDLGTRWSSGFSDSQWISVDLVWPTQIRTLVLRWEAAYGKDFKIQVSNDNASWTDASTVTGGTGGTQTLRLASPATGRYVRMLGSKRGTQYGYSLYEFEIYGH